MRIRGPLTLVLVAGSLTLPAAASAQSGPPLPDPNSAVDLLPRPCAYEGGDPHERATERNEPP